MSPTYCSQGWARAGARACAGDSLSTDPSPAAMTAAAPRTGTRAAVPGKGVAAVNRHPPAPTAARPAAAVSVHGQGEAAHSVPGQGGAAQSVRGQGEAG